MRGLVCVTVGLGTMLACSAGLGQEQPTSVYTLGWGDAIKVLVIAHPELSMTTTVLLDQTVTLPLAGRVEVGGMTLAELEDRLEELLSKRLADPEVYVSVVRPRDVYVYVLGDGAASTVRAMGPGLRRGEPEGESAGGEGGGEAVAVTLMPGWRVSHLLAAVGGLRTRPELVHAFLRRPGEELILLDMVAILARGSTDADVLLSPGDMLFVNRIDTVGIYVAGQVITPGSRPILLGQSAAKVIEAAGGVLPTADLRNILVLHADRTETRADLYDAVVNRDPARDIVLRAGDVLVVPALAGAGGRR